MGTLSLKRGSHLLKIAQQCQSWDQNPELWTHFLLFQRDLVERHPGSARRKVSWGWGEATLPSLPTWGAAHHFSRLTFRVIMSVGYVQVALTVS